jgi:hypothetical protein
MARIPARNIHFVLIRILLLSDSDGFILASGAVGATLFSDAGPTGRNCSGRLRESAAPDFYTISNFADSITPGKRGARNVVLSIFRVERQSGA